jgi:hypothetical protein
MNKQKQMSGQINNFCYENNNLTYCVDHCTSNFLVMDSWPATIFR